MGFRDQVQKKDEKKPKSGESGGKNSQLTESNVSIDIPIVNEKKDEVSIDPIPQEPEPKPKREKVNRRSDVNIGTVLLSECLYILRKLVGWKRFSTSYRQEGKQMSKLVERIEKHLYGG